MGRGLLMMGAVAVLWTQRGKIKGGDLLGAVAEVAGATGFAEKREARQFSLGTNCLWWFRRLQLLNFSTKKIPQKCFPTKKFVGKFVFLVKYVENFCAKTKFFVGKSPS